MGSSLSSRIKTAVVKNDGDGLRTLLQLPFVHATDAVNLPLNRRQDGALALAIRLGRYDLISVLLDAGAKVSFCGFMVSIIDDQSNYTVCTEIAARSVVQSGHSHRLSQPGH